MDKNKKRIIIGIIWSLFIISIGFLYVFLPYDFLNKYGMTYGLSEVWTNIIGISIILVGILWGILLLFTRVYGKLMNRYSKYGKLFIIFYISQWIITIFIFIFIGTVTMRVVQSLL